MASTTSPIGITQLKNVAARCVSIAPAATCEGTMSRNTKPHIAVRRRLIALNRGEDQYCSGTASRAYCSVNGVRSSEVNAISASSPAATPRA